MPRNTLLISDDRMLLHSMGEDHPERPERLAGILETLKSRPIAGTHWATATEAPREAITRVHDADYVARIDALRGKRQRLDPDTATCEDTVEAAYLSAGAAVGAVTALLEGRAQSAFALGRPPGHHAEKAKAMGFCFFGNIAIAAAHAVAEFGLQRVLIVDWDVHHGNGTQHTLDHRADILVFNIHQAPFYPGTGMAKSVGVGAGEGFSVNVPMTAGCGDGDYLAAFREMLVPIANEFAPELVLVSAGFDAHVNDPLGGMRVSTAGFAALCGIVRDLADAHAGGKLGLVLEGGYDVDALADGSHACTEILAGADAPTIDDAVSKPGRDAIEIAKARQRKFWPV